MRAALVLGWNSLSADLKVMWISCTIFSLYLLGDQVVLSFPSALNDSHFLVLQSHQQSGASPGGQTCYSCEPAQNTSTCAITGASSCPCHPSSSSCSSSSAAYGLASRASTSISSRLCGRRLQSACEERGDRDCQYLRGRCCHVLSQHIHLLNCWASWWLISNWGCRTCDVALH